MKATQLNHIPSQVRSITAGMTAKEKAFARAAESYFNGTSREAINAVSEKLKGYSLAKVEHYFPISSDSSFTKADFESVKFDGTIEGMGFLKERQAQAANPILLRDANDVVDQSIRMHSKYAGLAIPVRNFNKVWSVTAGSYNADGSRNAYESSVQQAVKKAWGETGYHYIEKMMRDLQGGAAKKDSWIKLLNKLRSSYAGAVLTLNMSVAMKQAASYPTAAAVLGWRPLARAMQDFGKVDLSLIERYTPLQWYRSKGFSTRELGDLKAADRQLPKVLNWVQGADLLTTRKLWKASEYYVRQHERSLRQGSDAYYRAVADIYNRVIEETQPNYTTMQRPQLLRSDDSLMGNLAMFKTQPFQNFNILYDAAGELRAAVKSGDTVRVKDARRTFGRAVSSQVAQLAVFAGMTMAWTLFRGKRDKYADEDGELAWDSVLKALGKDMAGGAMASVPFGSDVWELASSHLFGDAYYGMDAVTVTAISDTITSITDLTGAVGELLDSARTGTDFNWNSARLRLDSDLDDISKALGVPYENVANLFNATYRQVCVAANGKTLGEYQAMKLTVDPEKHSGDYYDLLYRAMQTDQAAYETIYRELSDGIFSEEKIRNAMEARMKAVQGVEHAEDLERRYLSPGETAAYEGALTEMVDSAIWQQADAQQRKRLEESLYNLTVENATGAAMQEKLAGGSAYGIGQEEYLLYRLALSMTDQPSESGKLGTYTNEEVEEAIRMLEGLSDEARSWLWTAQGKNEKSDPWR